MPEEQVQVDVGEPIMETVETPAAEITEPVKLGYSKNGLLKNVKCLICNGFLSEKGITYHMRNAHNCGQKKGTNFIVYNEDGTPQMSSKPYARKDGTAKPKDARCLLCGHISSYTAMYQHLKDKHNEKQELGRTLEKIVPAEVPIEQQQTTRSYVKKEVQSPQSGFITIPITIRIPYVFGKIEIQ